MCEGTSPEPSHGRLAIKAPLERIAEFLSERYRSLFTVELQGRSVHFSFCPSRPENVAGGLPSAGTWGHTSGFHGSRQQGGQGGMVISAHRAPRFGPPVVLLQAICVDSDGQYESFRITCQDRRVPALSQLLQILRTEFEVAECYETQASDEERAASAAPDATDEGECEPEAHTARAFLESIRSQEARPPVQDSLALVWAGRDGASGAAGKRSGASRAAYPPKAQRKIVNHYWEDKAKGMFDELPWDETERKRLTQEEWAKRNYQISARTLRRYIKKHPDLRPEA